MRALSIGLITTIALAALPAHAELTSQQQEWIEQSAPLVKASVSRSLSSLYQDVFDNKADSDLILGLTVLAGQGFPADNTYTDENMQVIEHKITSSYDAYVKKHPNRDLTRIYWDQALKVSKEDQNFIVTYYQLESADYWINKALSTVNYGTMQGANIDPMAAGSTGTGGSVIINKSTTLISKRYATPMVYTAAHCVLAVRLAAGLSVPYSPQQLKSYLLIPKQFTFAFTDNLVKNAQSDTYDKASLRGKEACGSEAQFQTYVSDLKTTLGL